jgi:uncharacterized cupredoxin-like copper-binding protein
MTMGRSVVARAVTAVVLGLASVACLAAAGGDGVRTVHVRIGYSAFVPDVIRVEPGETVRFVVRNDDPIDHEFLIGDETVQHVHEVGTEGHHGARPGEISVPAGQTVATTYTFGGAGSTLFGCHLPGHYAYGMRGTIQIG